MTFSESLTLASWSRTPQSVPAHPGLKTEAGTRLCTCSHHALKNFLLDSNTALLQGSSHHAEYENFSKNLEKSNTSHWTENGSNKDRGASSHRLGHSRAPVCSKNVKEGLVEITLPFFLPYGNLSSASSQAPRLLMHARSHPSLI